MIRWNLTILGLAGCLLFTGGCRQDTASGEKGGKNGKAPSAASAKPRTIKAARAAQRPLEHTVLVIGSLAAREQTTLSIKVPGRVEQITVDLGSVVRKGDLIVQLERADYELKLKQSEAFLAQARARLGLPLDGSDDRVDTEQTSTVKQAKAVLDEARANRDRVARLSKEKILAQSELDTADAAFQVALNRYQQALEDVRDRQATLAQRKAEVEIARQQLTDTTIRAPFEGAVQDRKTNLGEYLNVGSPIATLVQVNPLRLRVEVPERDAASVHAGQHVRLKVEGDTNFYTGQITRLSPAISDQTRMLVVEADVPNNGALRPGLFARADIITSEKLPVITVPTAGLVVFAGVEKMFIVNKEGKAQERAVATGRTGPGWVEVLSGIKAGDMVILNPGSLQTGQPVIVDNTAEEVAIDKGGTQ